MRVRVRSSDRVIEEEYSVCAGNALQEQFGHFGVEDGSDFLFRVPVSITHGRRDVGEGGEGITVERVGGFMTADVVYGHGVVFGGEVALWSRGWRFNIIPRLFFPVCY